jgi:hypothetical protein
MIEKNSTPRLCMNTFSPDLPQSLEQETVFSELRRHLAQEVSSCALLFELLACINRMEDCCSSPERFKVQFERFVPRAEEYLEVVRPYFPALVEYLPAGCHLHK